MKNKTKKILAGLCLGVTLGASGFMLSGCTSDITFNQKDLDTAIKNVNEYLETQNNYSSEFARNTLNGYLMDAMKDCVNSTSLRVSQNLTQIDVYGNKKVSNMGEYKFYLENGKSKEQFVDDTRTIYKESVLGEDGKYDCVTYNKEGSSKTYITENDQVTTNPVNRTVMFNNYNSAIMYVYNLLNAEELTFEDFIMETENNVVKFNAIAMNVEHGHYGNFEMQFTNGKLTKVVGIESAKEGNGISLYRMEINIEHNVADFTFDTTGYTLAE